ncbi:MAG TPA: hypothetical protein VFC82_11240, partial [Actinomycetaceae bacterium]|nr:hypothetical protein [Actinomycetaceae bacterium]
AKEDGMANYWHCIGTSTPGVAPPDDPDNWEPVDPPDGIEDGESVFGWDGEVAEDDIRAHETIGTIFPYPSGEPTHRVVSYDGSYPTWPDNVSFTTYADTLLFSIHCVVENDIPVAIRAYGTATDNLGFHAAVYTADGALVAETEIIAPPTGSGWYEMGVLPGASTLVDGQDYALVVRGEMYDFHEGFFLAYGLFSDYTPPDGGEWDPDEEYEYCQTVYYPDASTSDPSTSGGAFMLTGGGMF